MRHFDAFAQNLLKSTFVDGVIHRLSHLDIIERFHLTIQRDVANIHHRRVLRVGLPFGTIGHPRKVGRRGVFQILNIHIAQFKAHQM